jgi:hypothetical protein
MWISEKELTRIHSQLSEQSASHWRLDRIVKGQAEEIRFLRREIQKLQESNESLMKYWGVVQEFKPGELITRSDPTKSIQVAKNSK